MESLAHAACCRTRPPADQSAECVLCRAAFLRAQSTACSSPRHLLFGADAEPLSPTARYAA